MEPKVFPLLGRGKTQAVSLHPLTAGVRHHNRSCGIYGGQSDITKGFLRVLRGSPANIIAPKTPWSFSFIYHRRQYGWGEGVYRVFVGKPEGRRPLGRPRRRWVDNIRMDLQEVGCGYIDWIRLAQDRERWRTLVSAVMNLRVPWNAGNFLTDCKPVSFSRRTLHHGVNK